MPPRPYLNATGHSGQTDIVSTTGAPLDATNITSPSRTPAPDSNSGTTRRSNPHSDRVSIESIIRDGYLAVPICPPETAPIADRNWVAAAAVGDVIAQIRARYEVYRRNLHGILYATAAATNAMHTFRAEQGQPSAQQLDGLHRMLQGLYEQERSERQALWRDLSRLRLGLADLAALYLSSTRKLEILTAPDGDRT